MRELASIPAVKGIRLTFHRPIDRNWMIDGTCDWYLAATPRSWASRS